MPGIAVALLTEDREQSVVLNSRVESTNLARTVLSHGFPLGPSDAILRQLLDQRAEVARAIRSVSVDWQIEVQPGAQPATVLDTAHSTPGVQAALPVGYTFVSGDNGVHSFTNGVTFVTAGSQTVTATDTDTMTSYAEAGTKGKDGSDAAISGRFMIKLGDRRRASHPGSRHRESDRFTQNRVAVLCKA